jgi:hypothetical protein
LVEKACVWCLSRQNVGAAPSGSERAWVQNSSESLWQRCWEEVGILVGYVSTQLYIEENTEQFPSFRAPLADLQPSACWLRIPPTCQVLANPKVRVVGSGRPALPPSHLGQLVARLPATTRRTSVTATIAAQQRPHLVSRCFGQPARCLSSPLCPHRMCPSVS